MKQFYVDATIGEEAYDFTFFASDMNEALKIVTAVGFGVGLMTSHPLSITRIANKPTRGCSYRSFS